MRACASACVSVTCACACACTCELVIVHFCVRARKRAYSERNPKADLALQRVLLQCLLLILEELNKEQDYHICKTASLIVFVVLCQSVFVLLAHVCSVRGHAFVWCSEIMFQKFETSAGS